MHSNPATAGLTIDSVISAGRPTSHLNKNKNFPGHPENPGDPNRIGTPPTPVSVDSLVFREYQKNVLTIDLKNNNKDRSV